MKKLGDCHTSRRAPLKVSSSLDHDIMRTMRAMAPTSVSSLGGSTGVRNSQKKCTCASWSSAETRAFLSKSGSASISKRCASSMGRRTHSGKMSYHDRSRCS